MNHNAEAHRLQDLEAPGPHGTPPLSDRTVTLAEIPQFQSLLEQTGQPPVIQTRRRSRITTINLNTSHPCWLHTSAGLTLELQPGGNVFAPPLEIPAGTSLYLQIGGPKAAPMFQPVWQPEPASSDAGVPAAPDTTLPVTEPQASPPQAAPTPGVARRLWHRLFGSGEGRSA